jgi:hypothetical protein
MHRTRQFNRPGVLWVGLVAVVANLMPQPPKPLD